MGPVGRVIVYIIVALIVRQLGQGVIGLCEGIGFGLARIFSWPTFFMMLVIIGVAYPCAFSLYKGRKHSIWISGLAAAVTGTTFLAIAYRNQLSDPFLHLTMVVAGIEQFAVGALAALAAIGAGEIRFRPKLKKAYW